MVVKCHKYLGLFGRKVVAHIRARVGPILSYAFEMILLYRVH